MFLNFVLGGGLPLCFFFAEVSHLCAFRGRVVKILICSLVFNHVELNILLVCKRLYSLFLVHKIGDFPVS
jgi:hypothetical protein